MRDPDDHRQCKTVPGSPALLGLGPVARGATKSPFLPVILGAGSAFSPGRAWLVEAVQTRIVPPSNLVFL